MTQTAAPDPPPADAPPPEPPLPPTPRRWRAAIVAGVAALWAAAYLAQPAIGTRGQAAVGVLCFLGAAAVASRSLQSVSRRAVLWGLALQFGLAVAVIHSRHVRAAFEVAGAGVARLVDASDRGSEFVFGSLARPDGPAGFVFAFRALPPIIFVSSFFSVLYYLGVLQVLVRLLARVMSRLMGTSGAETLSVAASVFMGQTEAPLIVKPFVPRMTRSELLALMGSGMAHISGGMMAVYISYGADPVSILCTCVMACPCGLYLSKIVYPESGRPETLGSAAVHAPTPYVNAIDAAAGGVKDGLWLALNVAAMLVAFLAFIALFDSALGAVKPGLVGLGVPEGRLEWWPDGLTLEAAFGRLFAPVALLIGVEPGETGRVGSLLGIKLVANEHVAFLTLKGWGAGGGEPLSERSRLLAVYALTGFANFSSVGIQLGGIGAIAPGRRADLARLGLRALFVGFLATLVNAAVAGILL